MNYPVAQSMLHKFLFGKVINSGMSPEFYSRVVTLHYDTTQVKVKTTF